MKTQDKKTQNTTSAPLVIAIKQNHWLCLCGNQSRMPMDSVRSGEGQATTPFSPCTYLGLPIRSEASFYYLCNVCGRVIHKDTLRIVGYKFHKNTLSEAEKEAIDQDVERHGWPQHELKSQPIRAPKPSDLQRLIRFELANYWEMNPFAYMDEQELVDELSDAIIKSHIMVYEGEYEGITGRFMLVAWSLAINQYALYFLPQNSKSGSDIHLIKQDNDLYSEAYP